MSEVEYNIGDSVYYSGTDPDKRLLITKKTRDPNGNWKYSGVLFDQEVSDVSSERLRNSPLEKEAGKSSLVESDFS